MEGNTVTNSRIEDSEICPISNSSLFVLAMSVLTRIFKKKGKKGGQFNRYRKLNKHLKEKVLCGRLNLIKPEDS